MTLIAKYMTDLCNIQEWAHSNRRRFLFFFRKFNKKYAATAAYSSLLSAILAHLSCASADSKLYITINR